MDISNIKTPCYIVSENLLIKNLEILKSVSDAAGCRILLAQKAFSMYAFYPLIKKYLAGTASSGLFEAMLGSEEMGGETHIFSAAYREDEFDEILRVCGHIIFNSFSQWEKYRSKALRSGKSCGIRINPEHSTQTHSIYDPCGTGSRLGVTRSSFRGDLLDGIEGLHFHTLCEQNSDALLETLDAVEENFGRYIYKMRWVNFGGGHHITRPDYDKDALINRIKTFSQKYGVDIYLEPGEAVALNAGILISTVLDITENNGYNAILDTSAACHMPDVIEMPYRPAVEGAGLPGEKAYTYRLGGPTCLAGDMIGEYSFDHELHPGDRLIFKDMAIYTMVKNNTFNGINLPGIAVERPDGRIELIKNFGYADFKGRLS